MTTLTLRVNLYDKTIQPALADEPEVIAVGETVKLRLLGTGFTADDITALNTVIASDAVTPPLRARMRNDAMGDIAIFPFPGDDLSQGNGWFAEDVDGETAICCNIDLGTAQAYGLFGGVTLPDGVSRKIRLIVERSFPNENPTLFASDLLRVGSWSFPGHELRFIGRPKETDVSIDDVQELVNGAVAAFQNEVSGVKETLVEQASAIANAITSGSGDASGLIEALSGHFATKSDLSGAVSGMGQLFESGLSNVMSGVSGYMSGVVTISGDQTICGLKTFRQGIQFGDANTGTCRLYRDDNGRVVLSSGVDTGVGFYNGSSESHLHRFAEVGEVLSGVDAGLRAFGLGMNTSGIVYDSKGVLSALGMSGSGYYTDWNILGFLAEKISGIVQEEADLESGLYEAFGFTKDNPSGSGSFADMVCEALEECPVICGILDTLEIHSAALDNHEKRITSAEFRISGLERDTDWLLKKARMAGWGSPEDEDDESGGGGGGGDDDDPVDPPVPPPLT